jgi:hypothetical protein
MKRRCVLNKIMPKQLEVVSIFSGAGHFAASAWPEQKNITQGGQIVAPAPVVPAKTQPAATVKANVTNIQPQVVVISPDDGATFYGGQTCDIHWMTMGIPAGSKMKIEFVRSDGTKLTLGDNLSIPGDFQWKINEPAFLTKQVPYGYGGTYYFPQNTQGKIKLTTSSEGKTYENERSISILMPGLKITNPKQGDTWHVGQTYTVTWQNIGPPLPKVYLVIGAGSGYASIPSYTTNGANTGSASINLPASALFPNWTGSYWVSVQSNATSFPEMYIYDSVTINMMK